MSDLINRQDAIDALSRGSGCGNSCRKAIENLPSAELNTALYIDGFNDGYEQCRQDAINVLDTGLWGVEWDKALATAMLKDLPSAQRKGHWILHQDSRTWECSECHKYQVIHSDYCMHCGAKMEETEWVI